MSNTNPNFPNENTNPPLKQTDIPIPQSHRERDSTNLLPLQEHPQSYPDQHHINPPSPRDQEKAQNKYHSPKDHLQKNIISKQDKPTRDDAQNFKYNDIPDPELQSHLKLIKQWLIKYNTFDYDNQSAGKLSSLNPDDINIVLNHKTNFTRIKLFVDYLELDALCPNFSLALRANFLKYNKYINFLTRKILLSSRKIKEDTSVFTDFILLNFPFLFGKLSKQHLIQIAFSKSGWLSFSKCHVTKVNIPIYLLWSKKVYKKCECTANENTKRYFNIFTKNIKYNNKFNNGTTCSECHREYYHDTKSDIFIECQEIEVVAETEDGLINNTFHVWAFGDWINSVKEGNCITINAYRIPENINCFEKNFDFGYLVALNFNLNFTSMEWLSPDNFKICNYLDLDVIGNRNGAVAEPQEQVKISDVLGSLQFQREFNASYYKFLIQNYIFNKRKETINFNNNTNASKVIFPIVNENYLPFLNLVLDLSIAQRDYSNHNSKIVFFQNSNANYWVELDNRTKSKVCPTKNNYNADMLTNSRNWVFKSNIFGNNTRGRMNNQNKKMKFNDFKKYFRLCKQINSSTTSTSDLLNKPFHLFLLFDNTINDPVYLMLHKYVNCWYTNLIVAYPFFNQSKFDKSNILNFFYKNNNKVIVIENVDTLGKAETDLITTIMENNTITASHETYQMKCVNDHSNSSAGNDSVFSNLNITFWFCCGTHRFSEGGWSGNNKKNSTTAFNQPLKIKHCEGLMNRSELVLNFSKKNLKTKGNIDWINDNTIVSYWNDLNQSKLSNEDVIDLFGHYNYINYKIDTSCRTNHILNKDFNDSFFSAKLIEDYFISKRDITKITFDDLFTWLRIAIFNSMLRANYENRKIIIPSSISNTNYIDSFFAIVLYEEGSVYKYGIENRSFGNVSEKLMYMDYNKDIQSVIQNLWTKKEEDVGGCNSKIIPKSKTMKKITRTEGVSCIRSDANNIKQPPSCELCKEISKIEKGKDWLCECFDKVKNFIYKDLNMLCCD